MSDTPDTSKANVARVLRCIAKACPSAQVDCTDRLWSIREACNVAADALERQASVPWSERVERADCAYVSAQLKGHPCAEWRAIRLDAALRAAFPDLCPKEPTP